MSGQAVTPGTAAGRYIPPSHTDRSIGATIAGIAFEHPSRRRWFIAFGLSVLMAGWLVVALLWLFYWGVGVWGNNIPVGWALDIVSYDWWMGVACGALMVSALLLLLRQYWRGALNRAAETVALLCAAAAGVYPIIHLGRSWFFYWTFPYPNNLLLWPQFRSPLVWDAFDITSFLVVALLFWYVGMLPDLATLRDRAVPLLPKRLYGIAALGWRGSAVHWARWLQAYRILAVLGLLQAVCVQCGASVMYAGTLEPGWHDTLLPIIFIVTSALSGLGMTAVLVAVIRYLYPVESLITRRHLDVLGRLILAVGLLLTYCYCADFFFTALGGDSYERGAMLRRFAGTYAWSWWFVVAFALLPVHLLWFAPIRRSAGMLFVIGLAMMLGVWGDHFMTLIMTQHRDFLPSSQAFYTASFWSITTFLGTIGLFSALVLLVIRYVPIASIIESRLLARQQEERAHV
jgi:Ni/Fe-hydrogenase subunit HybB-like protein